jgi:hypothetical protein
MELTIRPLVAAIAGDDFAAALEQFLQRETVSTGEDPDDAPPEERPQAQTEAAQ